MHERYTPCRVLQEHNIACTCWFEDAVAHYGVPTVLFDLYLLVQDMDVAAQVLLDQGWEQAPGRDNDVYCFHNDKECKPYRRLVHSARPNVHTFLMNATDWAFPNERLGGGQRVGGSISPLSSSSASSSTSSADTPLFPRLPELMDALIDSILDSEEGERVSGHLSMMLMYLYGHVPVLKQDTFADQLAYEHRQFHYDMKAIIDFSLRFIAYERKVRQQVRDGTLVPHYDPYNNDRECLS